MIVGKEDAPLFEAELQAGVKADGQAKNDSKKDESHLPTFIVHASIDVVEETVWKNSNMYAPISRAIRSLAPKFATFSKIVKMHLY